MSVTVTIARAAASGNVPASFQPGQLGIDEFLGNFYWRQNSGLVAAFPLLAPANTILGNNTGSAVAPRYLTASQVLALTGAATLASPTFTGTVTVPTLALTGAMAITSYNVATPASAATVTIASTTTVQIIAPTATLSALTINLPGSPLDGQRVTITFVNAVTSLTIAASGKTIKNAPTTAAAGLAFDYLYVSSSSTWYKVA